MLKAKCLPESIPEKLITSLFSPTRDFQAGFYLVLRLVSFAQVLDDKGYGIFSCRKGNLYILSGKRISIRPLCG
jgi:hypothetical protein